VIVEVHAASINPFDQKIRSGFFKEDIPLTFPAVLGGDFSGEVIEVAEGITEYKLGDEIYGSASILNGGSGSFAEVATVNTVNSAYKPSNLSFEEAASIPLVGSSAIQALEKHIMLKKGQKILIHGGAGGIGSIAIQLAKYIGAYVATTVSENDKKFVIDLGADEAIDYKNQKFEDIVSDYDAVFDNVGGDTVDRSFKVLKKGGIIVSMLGEPKKELAEEYGVRTIGQGTDTVVPYLERLRELVEDGKIKPIIDKIFPMEQVKEAFNYQEKNHPRGKVVLSMTS